jgi:hypothetical protein
MRLNVVLYRVCACSPDLDSISHFEPMDPDPDPTTTNSSDAHAKEALVDLPKY